MKIAILSRGPSLYSTRRLKEAALAKGHDIRVLNTLRFSIQVEQGKPELFYRGQKLSHYDGVIWYTGDDNVTRTRRTPSRSRATSCARSRS